MPDSASRDILARAGGSVGSGRVMKPKCGKNPPPAGLRQHDLNGRARIALATQDRPREAFNALDAVRGRALRDTQELERVLRTMLGSTAEPGGSFYSDFLQPSRGTLRAHSHAFAGVGHGVGGNERARARAAEGAQRKRARSRLTGVLTVRHDDGWFGVTQRLARPHVSGARRSCSGGAGASHDIRAKIKPFDGLKLSLERSSAKFVRPIRRVGRDRAGWIIVLYSICPRWFVRHAWLKLVAPGAVGS